MGNRRGNFFQHQFKFLVSLVLCTFLTTLLGSSVQAAALTSVSNIPWSSDISVSGKHTVKFTTVTSTPADGKIVITFPSGFNVASATFDSWSGFDGGRSVSIAGQVITINRDGTGSASGAGAKYIVLNNITNNSTATTYTLSVETQDSGSSTIDGPTTSSSFSVTGTSDGYRSSDLWRGLTNDAKGSRKFSTAGPNYPAVQLLTTLAGNVCDSLRSVVVGGDGVIYLVANSCNTLYAINPDGTTKWSTALSSPSGYNGNNSLILSNEYVYLSNQYGSHMKAYNRETGTLTWTFTFTTPTAFGWAYNPPAIGSDGTVLVQSTGNPSPIIGINSDGTTKFIGANISGAADETTLVFDNNYLIAHDRAGSIKKVTMDGQSVATFASSPAGGRILGSTVFLDSNNNFFTTSQNGVIGINSSGSTIYGKTSPKGSNYASGVLLPSNQLFVFGDYANSTKLTGISTVDGSTIWTNISFTGSDPIIDSNERIYNTNDVFNPNTGSRIWEYSTVSRYVPAGDSKVYGVVSNKIYLINNWTLTGSVNDDSIKTGDVITITATSGMLKRDPNATIDNQVQAVISNGDKVTLAYDSTSGSNTVWKGTYSVPEGTADGSLAITLQAIAYNITTDVTTTFDSLPSGFNNTGITASINPLVDNTNPSSSSTAVQINVDGKTYDKYFNPLSIPDLSSVGDNDHPQFCFSKAYDASNGSGISSYTVRVDGRDYLSNIPYNAPSIDGTQTKADGEHNIIKDTDEYYYRYSNYDRPQESQDICVYGKGDKYKLYSGFHSWSVKTSDNAGNNTETDTKRFLVKTSTGSFFSSGAGWGDTQNTDYKPGFSQNEWFPVSILQIGNKSFVNELSTLNPIVFNSERPFSISTSNPTIYGIANSGSKVYLTITKEYFDEGLQRRTREQITKQETTANESSNWGITLTKDITTLLSNTFKDKPLYFVTVTVEKENKLAILYDIPVSLSTVYTSQPVLGVTDKKTTKTVKKKAQIEKKETIAVKTKDSEPTPSLLSKVLDYFK